MSNPPTAVATVPTSGNPFARVATADVNQGTIDIESSRAIAEAQGKLVIAKKFPRDQAKAYDQVMETCKRLSFAEEATYSLPRGKDPVTGPSIRLAEECARAWGNIDFGLRELSRKPSKADEPGYSEMQAYAWDLETNVMSTQNWTVKHWRDTKQGGRALRDETEIYEVTASQGGRRLRSRILAILPPDLIEGAVTACELTTRNALSQDLEGKTKKMVAAFAKIGVTEDMIVARLRHPLKNITVDELEELRKIFPSIRDGMSKIEDWFGEKAPARPAFGGGNKEPVVVTPAPEPDRLAPLRSLMDAEGITDEALIPYLNAAVLEEGRDIKALASLTDEEIAMVGKEWGNIAKAVKGVEK